MGPARHDRILSGNALHNHRELAEREVYERESRHRVLCLHHDQPFAYRLRGAFKSLAELEQAIYDYLAKHNQNPVPFVWIATAKTILKKTARANQTLETVKAGTKC